MANTYEAIATITLGSDQANVEFTSIPATYTDLVVLVSARLVRATNGGTLNVNFNGSSANLSARNMWGSGSTTSSNTDARLVALIPGGNTTASVFSNFQLYVPNYAGSTNKSWSSDFVSENNATAGYDGFTAGLWSQTTAINAIKFIDNGAGDLLSGSTFYLYGIKNS
jgi:hypothetical protein